MCHPISQVNWKRERRTGSRSTTTSRNQVGTPELHPGRIGRRDRRAGLAREKSAPLTSREKSGLTPNLSRAQPWGRLKMKNAPAMNRPTTCDGSWRRQWSFAVLHKPCLMPRAYRLSRGGSGWWWCLGHRRGGRQRATARRRMTAAVRHQRCLGARLRGARFLPFARLAQSNPPSRCGLSGSPLRGDARP